MFALGVRPCDGGWTDGTMPVVLEASAPNGGRPSPAPRLIVFPDGTARCPVGSGRLAR